MASVGRATYRLIEELIAPATVSERSYIVLVNKLKAHFEPQTSVIEARFRFYSCERSDDEPVSEFLARLRKLAKPCQFGPTALDEMLRDRLVCGIRHERLQSRLLSEPRLTLQSAVELAQAQESAAASVAELSGGAGGGTSGDAVHQVGGGGVSRPAGGGTSGDAAHRAGGASSSRPAPGPPRQSQDGEGWRQRDRGSGPRECSRCLRSHRPASCPFRDKQCFACGKRGHIRAACGRRSRSQHLRQLTSDQELQLVAEPAQKEGGGATGRSSRGVRDPERDEAYPMFSVQPEESARRDVGARRPPLMVKVALDGRDVEMELDTGAALSVCSDSVFKQLWPSSGPVIEPCAVKLKTYSGEALSVRGKAMVRVEYGGHSTRLPLVVVKGSGPCLFGRNWLSHIRLDWPAICRISSQSHGQVQPVLDEFPDVFREELGCYRGGEVTIEVDQDVQPRFFKPRPVPLAYREAVDSELEKQIQQGLWEPVKHSKWAAPLVIVPKADGIRICGDYRLTINKAAKVGINKV